MENDSKTLGDNLREIRNLRKLSLRNVEEATGISNAYLSQLENDKITKPSPNFLYKLSVLFDVDYQLLMEKAGYAGPKKNNSDSKINGSGPKTLSGAALFSTENLTPREEEKLVEYLRFLRSQPK
jgi:transcriptional regulator with XRE-family HTH domain